MNSNKANKKVVGSNRKNISNLSFFLVSFSFFFPLLGWIIGTIVNPQGWMSEIGGFLYILIFSVYGLVSGWFTWLPWLLVTFPTFVALIIITVTLIYKKKYLLLSWLYTVLNFGYAIFVYMLTSSAQDSEFTG